MIRRWLLALLLALVVVSTTEAATIVNGDFETAGVLPDDFDGWSTLAPGFFFDRPTAATDAAGRYAVFTDDGTVGSDQLEQVYDIPGDALSLSFDFLLETDGTPGAGTVPDAFQTTQLDVLFSPILPGGPGGAYYSVDNLGNELFNPAVSFVTSAADLRSGWKRVVLDVTGVSPQTGVILEFSLLKSFVDDGVTTTVSLDNVVLATGVASVVPEPMSLSIWGLLALVGCLGRRWIPNRRRSVA